MKVAVIGGGINGIMTTWELLKKGHCVTLFEKEGLMEQTSSKSSKLLHGGLRYLENGEFRLVKEALRERQWWVSQAPNLAQPLKIYIPIYTSNQRSSWLYKLGLTLYDILAGKKNIAKHQSINKKQMVLDCSELKCKGLVKGLFYFDAQMDDYKLGLWAIDQAKKYENLSILENTLVQEIDADGNVGYRDSTRVERVCKFDRVINITGPWAEKLLTDNEISTQYKLDLVRGTHVVVDRQLNHGYFLEIPNERRIFFVLPYQGQTLIGTTEVRQTLMEKIEASEKEVITLMNAYNSYFKEPIIKSDITRSFAGLRPLIKCGSDASKVTREYVIETNHNLMIVFGGKWTTSRQLAKKISQIL